jgi:hypothetical protein
MAGFARTLGNTADVTKWEAAAEEWRARTDGLWNGTRYADFDASAVAFTAEDDVMLLSPLALDVATSERVEASHSAVQALDAERLVWPMFVWTAVEAAMTAGQTDKAAEIAAAICDRAFGFWDARHIAPGQTLPGISCEYWPPSGRCGGEGYGWGAFTTHLVLHTLIGFDPKRERLEVRPNLPPAWRVAGRSYRALLHARSNPLSITIEPLDGERVRLALNEQVTETSWGRTVLFDWNTLS